MGLTLPGGIGVAVGLVALLIIALVILTGHCSFNGSVSLGIR